MKYEKADKLGFGEVLREWKSAAYSMLAGAAILFGAFTLATKPSGLEKTLQEPPKPAVKPAQAYDINSAIVIGNPINSIAAELLNCGEKATVSATVRDSVGEDYKSRIQQTQPSTNYKPE